MKIPSRLALLLTLALAASGVAQNSPPETATYHPIFNGTNLAGWKGPQPNRFWTPSEGVLKGENDPGLKGNVLYTAAEYRDFVLEAEVRWSGEIDSGIMFRKPELQLQFGVSRSLKTDMTGSFYTGGSVGYPESGRARKISEVFKPGDWNKIHLEARGDTFTVWINDVATTKYTDTRFGGPGPIGLQVHPGVKMHVEFRNLRIKSLQ